MMDFDQTILIAQILSGSIVFGCFLGLVIFSVHNLSMIAAFLRKRRPHSRIEDIERRKGEELTSFPKVLIQLPVYNEKHVAERVLRAAAAIDWPREKLLIQVLDDSDDETSAIIDNCVAALREQGHNIIAVRRPARAGFKAGALAFGLSLSDAEYVAVFDADFVPSRDFVRRAIQPLLADSRLCVVQCRWDHLNPDENRITQVQATGLDYHFGVEQAAKAWSSLPMHFNGTCGLWRVSAIHAAGGWQADTVTEDIDLSYRAQLAGYRCTYRFGISVPGELPDTIGAWRSQQFRWAKGSTQVACKLLPAIWRSDWPLLHKITASIHLLHYSINALILLNALFYPLAINMLSVLPWIFKILFGLTLLFALAATCLCYVISQRIVRGRGLAEILRRFPVYMSLGAGLALSNTKAIFEAITTKDAAFIRTPKKGRAGESSYRLAAKSGIPELFLAGWALWGCFAGLTALTPITLVCVGGFWWVGSLSLFAYLQAIGSSRRDLASN